MLGRDTVRAVQERVCALARARCSIMRLLVGLLIAHDRSECRISSGSCLRRSFREQDNGLLIGQIIADQSISFQSMKKKLEQLQQIVQKDPAVESVIGFTGTRALNTANVFVGLKPLAQRQACRPLQVVRAPTAAAQPRVRCQLFLQAVQDLHIGGRQSAAEYQYTLTSEDTAALYTWTPRLLDGARQVPRRRLDGCEFGPAAERAADLRQHRPRHRHALRLCAEPDRQCALRCLRSAHRIDHFQPLQSILRGDGGGTEVLAVPADARPHVFQHRGRQSERHRSRPRRKAAR